jgi:hypothetical protein
MELGAMTSRVVWRTLRDTQTITAITVIAGSSVKALALPFLVMASAAPKPATAVKSAKAKVLPGFMGSGYAQRDYAMAA